jgi:hypothetical protein
LKTAIALTLRADPKTNFGAWIKSKYSGFFLPLKIMGKRLNLIRISSQPQDFKEARLMLASMALLTRASRVFHPYYKLRQRQLSFGPNYTRANKVQEFLRR